MTTRARRIAWTSKQLAWIEAHNSMIRREAHAEFCKTFKVAVSYGAYASLCKRMGWKTGRAWLKQPGRKHRNVSKKWDAGELAWIESNCTMPRRDLHAAFCKRFWRTDVSVDDIKALCTRNGWKTGRDGRIQKGSVSWNTGKKMPYNANRAKTQFKKGHRGGVAKERYKPLGTERLSKDGYLERKIHDGMPLQSRWRAVHLVNWEAINGPLPKGHCLKCRDGDKSNTDPSNWQLIPLGVNALLNSRWSKLRYNDAPDELKSIVMAVAKLKHARSKKARAKKSPPTERTTP
jgi:hypothetical protein